VSKKELFAVNKEQLERIQKDLHESGLKWLHTGAFLINSRGEISKVVSISQEAREFYDEAQKKTRKRPETFIYLVDYIGENKWETELNTHSVSDIEKYFTLLDVPDVEKYLEDIASKILEEEESEPEPVQSDSTELGFKLGKEQIVELQETVNRKLMEVQSKERALKGILESKQQELYRIQEKFQKQLKTIGRAIGSIELYLGIGEEISHLVKGPQADKDEPIVIRQMLLYMDEEVAEWRNGGLDFQSIELFDTWIKTGRNFEKVLPEKKGVVGIRVRRNQKKYQGYDAILQERYDQANRNCYFLIRNGENVYALWTAIGESFPRRLFPKKDELQEMLDEYQKTHWETEKEKIEDKMFFYKRIFLVLKGIIERTEIFKPYPDHLQVFNIFDPKSYGDYIRYLYDEEALLPDGRLRYAEWKKQLNKTITRGSRIYVGRTAPNTGRAASLYSESVDSERILFYTNQHINGPTPGLYTVEEGAEKVSVPIYNYYEVVTGKEDKTLPNFTDEDWENYDVSIGQRVVGRGRRNLIKGDIIRENSGKYRQVTQKYLYIRYNPGGTAYAGWGDYGHERKKRITYKIYEDDAFIFNYDALPYEDIDFYLESRVDRPNYLHMIPTLSDLKELRNEEMAWEKHFVDLTASSVIKQVKTSDDLELDVILETWEAVEWWKRKCIWKRPISKDDAKALRMIKSRVIKKVTNFKSGK